MREAVLSFVPPGPLPEGDFAQGVLDGPAGRHSYGFDKASRRLAWLDRDGVDVMPGEPLWEDAQRTLREAAGRDRRPFVAPPPPPRPDAVFEAPDDGGGVGDGPQPPVPVAVPPPPAPPAPPEPVLAAFEAPVAVQAADRVPAGVRRSQGPRQRLVTGGSGPSLKTHAEMAADSGFTQVNSFEAENEALMARMAGGGGGWSSGPDPDEERMFRDATSRLQAGQVLDPGHRKGADPFAASSMADGESREGLGMDVGFGLID